MLLNIGANLTRHCFDYLIFHDVDKLPEPPNSPRYYRYNPNPLHLASAANQYPNKPYYPTYVGGVFLIPTATFLSINGFTNKYWGWGYEDDEFHLRLKRSGVGFERLDPVDLGFYNCVFGKANTERNRTNYLSNRALFNTVRGKNAVHNFHEDGLNSLQFEIVDQWRESHSVSQIVVSI